MDPQKVPVPFLSALLPDGVVLGSVTSDKRGLNILISGPSGSGKTIFAGQLATALARALNGDVAYGSLEMFPSMLAAQRAPFARSVFGADLLVPKWEVPARGEDPRTFAAVLDYPGGSEPRQLGPEMDAFLRKISEKGGDAKVLVVDGLCNAYGLGDAVPREYADAVCKFALERGLVLVLVYDGLTLSTAVWKYVVDLHIELDFPRVGARRSLRATVVKNRFGATDRRPRNFEINAAHGVDFEFSPPAQD